MADASDSKSDVGDYVWVQVPSPALYISEESWIDGFFDFFILRQSKKDRCSWNCRSFNIFCYYVYVAI